VGTHSAEQSARIAARPTACFAALCDFETYPDWQQAVDSVEVLEREGDVAAVDGEFVLEPEGEDATQATYRLGIDPGVPVPGLLARQLTKGVMRRSVTDLRDEVERRAS